MDRTYRVKWEIDLDAGSPEEAAREALAVQRDPDSTATVFSVRDSGYGGNGQVVDAGGVPQEPRNVRGNESFWGKPCSQHCHRKAASPAPFNAAR